MQKILIDTLTISTGISRGQYTSGYRIVRLKSGTTGKTYKSCGGGYDMVGDCLGQYLEDTQQTALRASCASSLYGAHKLESGHIYLDGACGVSCMQAIAEHIGLHIEYMPSKSGQTAGFLVYRHE